MKSKMKKKEHLSIANEITIKLASRAAEEKDFDAGFQESAPIFSSRSLKSEADLAKKPSIKRKFNFNQIFDDHNDDYSIDHISSHESTDLKRTNDKRKKDKKSPRKFKISERNHHIINLNDYSGRDHASDQKAKSKRVNHLKGSHSTDQSIPFIPSSCKELDFEECSFSNAKPLSSMIVSQRAAAVNPKATYQESESSEDELISKAPAAKKQSKSQRDYGYSEGKSSIRSDLLRLESFHVPVLKRIFHGKSIDLSKFKVKANESIAENQQKCPIGLFCNALLPITLSPRLSKALEKYNDLKSKCDSGKVSHDAVVRARDQFCLLHQAEDTIIPRGIKKGYQTNINFSDITSRLENCASRFDLIISKKLDSTFLVETLDVIAEIGQAKARGVDAQMLGAQKSQCGYYGITGYNCIFKYLLDKYHSIKPSVVHPLTVVEFIQLVLVPEAALVLIAQDFKWDVDKEKKKVLKILADSHEFGNLVHDESNDDLLHGLEQYHLI